MCENQGKDKEVRSMWKEKGQNIIEYALMLALVVGIGSFIYTQGYGGQHFRRFQPCRKPVGRGE